MANDEDNTNPFIKGLWEMAVSFVEFMALKQYQYALSVAPCDMIDQVVKNAVLCGDYRGVKESGTAVNMEWFVPNKVLPFLRVHEREGGFFVDEQLLTQSLAELDGDPQARLIQALEMLDTQGFNDPIKKLILATYTKDPFIISRYEGVCALVPERRNLEQCLKENGIQVTGVIQSGDDRRYYPKDGNVFLAQANGHRVVLKEILRLHSDYSCLDGKTNEDEILKTLNHPNIVRYLGKIQVDGHEFIILDYIDAVKKPHGEKAVKEELSQIADAYIHLKKKGVLYLDFKEKNILYDGSKTIMIDFGWAQFKKDVNYTDLSTSRYIVPETLLTLQADSRSDIFALGIYAHERLTGRHPFTDCNISDSDIQGSLIHYAVANTLHQWDSLSISPQPVSLKLKTLIGAMLEKAPENRPGFEDLLQVAA